MNSCEKKSKAKSKTINDFPMESFRIYKNSFKTKKYITYHPEMAITQWIVRLKNVLPSWVAYDSFSKKNQNQISPKKTKHFKKNWKNRWINRDELKIDGKKAAIKA